LRRHAHVKIEDVDVIAPNFKRRLSGVTSTIVQLVPLQAEMGVRIAALGPGLPEHLPHIRFGDLWRLWKKRSGKLARVWHARRNVEMVAGVIMRDVLRMPVKLVFTSDAQRRHRRFTRFLMRRMDEIIACSTGGAAFLDLPYTMIQHGVHTRKYAPAEIGKAAAKTRVNLDADLKHVGCFGRVRHQKGTDLFVDAMIKLLPEFPQWRAIICGRATEEHAAFDAGLRARANAAGLADRILFLGEVEDILPYYQAIDLYVAPSRNEGFGLTPLEAMACGAAIITSDAGAYRDMVQPGLNGVLCAAGDGAALTAAIEEMLGQPAKLAEMGHYGVQFVRKNFGLEQEASALNALYAALILKADPS
jgi:mannosyltransferase